MATTSAANADPAREVTFFELGLDILAASGKHDPRNGISIGTMWKTVHDDAQQLVSHNGTVRRQNLDIIDGVDDLLEREAVQNKVPIWEGALPS